MALASGVFGLNPESTKSPIDDRMGWAGGSPVIVTNVLAETGRADEATVARERDGLPFRSPPRRAAARRRRAFRELGKERASHEDRCADGRCDEARPESGLRDVLICQREHSDNRPVEPARESATITWN
jgi:hypothetical protein